jgi:GTP-binding protein LepA
MKNIRNFCIIAHIDHGKSTLADRLLQQTNTVSDRELSEQTLDDMDIEKERGITIKSHAIQMDYEQEGEAYTLNLIDTPGHVDFSYEVSRSIAACEGALLIVDAAQGIQAQTISNLYLALENDLEIIPVLNKMDLPGAQPEEVKDQIVDLIGCEREKIIPASGKTGLGVTEILKAVVEDVPPPKGDPHAPLQAMIFDSVFNPFRGIIAYYRVLNGSVKKGAKVKFFNTGKSYNADEIGILRLDMESRKEVNTGDVGYIISGIKSAADVKVGDTLTDSDNPCESAVEGFEDVKPMVFAGVYPVVTDDYEDLRNAMEKLQLNDASLTFEPESSVALGFGFRCGFLGMLHLEIITERLEREFEMDVITTVPNVSYITYTKRGDKLLVNNPSELPDPSAIDWIEEPYIKAQVITKSDYVGSVMTLAIEKRGELSNQVYLSSDRVELSFEMPLAEIVFDFYDRLKSVSKGYASFDYYPSGMRQSNLKKMDILLNGDNVDALSALIHADNAFTLGKKICKKLKELIPRQQFVIAIQAAIGAKIIARETISALRKDVTAKCYGGDISRKRKLLEKQKAGKKKMRQIGSVEIPQSAFLAVLKLDD